MLKLCSYGVRDLLCLSHIHRCIQHYSKSLQSNRSRFSLLCFQLLGGISRLLNSTSSLHFNQADSIIEKGIVKCFRGQIHKRSTPVHKDEEKLLVPCEFYENS